jgi:hypothetical protein
MIPMAKCLATAAVWACVLLLFLKVPELPKGLVDDGVKGFFFLLAMTTITGSIWKSWGKELDDD